ncbi:hypothetical protein B0H17DRAFT_1140629 [Mycena rosella]|uniref:F-box domain-containing protein n=1 Tax=Mycena rosella TaxID=1033263 RepID=A0AAD7D1E5_MYCRO|nr:hypothetical protein B0H17DRAFT_1140629 [Mycena rosella]
MPDVPVELLHAIATGVKSDSVLLQLRLVSKTLNSVVTPLAFRAITVKDSVQSANVLSFLQDCDTSITSAVREVIFKGDPKGWRAEADTSGEAGRQALKTAFSGLAKFPNLEQLRFNFHDGYEEDFSHDIPENSTHSLRLQLDIFAGLASSPPPTLVSLTLNNVVAVPNAIYEEEAFHSVFRGLRTLHLSVLSDTYNEGSYFQYPLVEFWAKSVAYIIRSATAVTSLTIRSDQAVGRYPALSFKDTHLPHLESLTLESFVFEPMIPDSDVVVFILAHKARLTHLTLRECSIDGGEDCVFLRPWHAVLALFEAELGCLRTFLLDDHGKAGEDEDEDENAVERDLQFVYTRLDPGYGYMPVDSAVAGTDGDSAALASLMAALESRRTAEAADGADDGN